MLAPITGLAVVLKQIAEKNGEPARGPLLPRRLPPPPSNVGGIFFFKFYN